MIETASLIVEQLSINVTSASATMKRLLRRTLHRLVSFSASGIASSNCPVTNFKNQHNA